MHAGLDSPGSGMDVTGVLTSHTRTDLVRTSFHPASAS